MADGCRLAHMAKYTTLMAVRDEWKGHNNLNVIIIGFQQYNS